MTEDTLLQRHQTHPKPARDMKNKETVRETLDTKGWVKLPSVFSESLIDNIMEEFNLLAPEFIKIQQQQGIANLVENTTHHTFVICRRMLHLLEDECVNAFLHDYFEGPFILNTMGLSQISNTNKTYTENIHRDIRSFSGSNRLWLNAIILLTDSTVDNGATWMLEGSQHVAEKPEEAFFYENAVRATGKKGDMILFDGNMWHAAGRNTTPEPRYIITPFYSKPYIKQQLDYPRALGIDFGKTLSNELAQILGYNAMVPVSLNEFYQPDEYRFYKKDQG
ncbi:MAG: phytanoyl-CoA dioxygenase family protein [Pseudomonadota bacterium]